MISQSDSINTVIKEWINKGCIDPHTELLCKTLLAVIKEQERTNLLLLEILNRQIRDKK